MQAYLNGHFLPLNEARVSVLDRGFMFGDGAYEVIRNYNGRPFLLDAHLLRFASSLDALRISGVDMQGVKDVAIRLIEECEDADSTLYIQVTRGAVPTRTHAFGQQQQSQQNPFEDSFPSLRISPTVFMYAMPFPDSNAPLREKGCSVRTFSDIRWARCDIKSLNLLGNVFAAQFAKENDTYESILFDSAGNVTEGSHTNVFVVQDGVLRTKENCERILPGITRKLVLQLAEKLSIPAVEKAVSVEELRTASEVFLTGTTTEVMPVILCDGQAIGAGVPGPIAIQLRNAYADLCTRGSTGT